MWGKHTAKLPMLLKTTTMRLIRQGTKTIYLSALSAVQYFDDITNTFTIVILVVPHRTYAWAACGKSRNIKKKH